MNKIILILAIITTMSCQDDIVINKTLENLKVEPIMGIPNYGLSRIIIDDTTTILMYKGYQSVSIIQLK
jgi:hypothetical protein